jgi:hypothetical protein
MSHDVGQASKPYANPLGILIGLVILWAVASGLMYAAFLFWHLGGDAG